MGFISFKNVKFKYPQRNEYAVDDVSFTIEKGAYVSIVGHNGSGKSTIARLLCGLDVPESGSIEIAQGNQIGIVFQSPKEQLVSAIVSRDTSFGPQNLGLPKSEVELRTIESLNVVDMLDRASSSTNALSLGQTQKIAFHAHRGRSASTRPQPHRCRRPLLRPPCQTLCRARHRRPGHVKLMKTASGFHQ